MKKIFPAQSAVAICTLFFAQQSAAQNTNAYPVGTNVSFIRTWDATAPETNPNTLITRPLQDVKMATQYVDGLGRPLQTVVKQGSQETGGAATDMVSPVMYDEYGREQFKYLSFVANNTGGNASITDGGFKLNPYQQQQTFMTAQYGAQGESFFYSKTNFEASPLGRTEKALAPGISWAGSSRGIESKYWYNTDLDTVQIWNVSPASVGTFGTCTSSGPYATGQLYKNIIVDEQGKQVIEFKDKEGKVILKKVQIGTVAGVADDGTGRGYTNWLSTYYIYDYQNNLRCVIQPEGVKQLAGSNWLLTATLLNEQCFRYEYDQRNRMVMKKVPGSGEVYLVYDAKDELVMTQDANMRSQGTGKWMVIKYDGLNRPVETGLWTDNTNTPFTSHLINAGNSAAYPTTTSGYELLTITHYDDYAGLPAPLLATYISTWDNYFSATSNTQWPYPQMPVQTNALKGMVGWTKTNILGTGNYLYSVNIYDEKGRTIQVQTANITGGVDVVTTQYTWAGQPLVTVQRQQKNGNNAQGHVVVTKMEYDDLGRLLAMKKSISSTVGGISMTKPEQLILSNKYDKLGQLKEKQLGAGPGTPLWGAGGLLTYDYNIRGWLLGMNRDYARDANSTNYFGFDLGYDKTNNNLIGGQTYTNPQYNGNIEGMVWKSKGDGEKRKYDFSYDAANRLLKADFTQYTNNTFNQSAGVIFDVKMGDGITAESAYDANGNIKQMQQWGLKITSSAQIDNLGYNYMPGSNKLLNVIDASNDPQTLLGDFRTSALHPNQTKTATTVDYTYDANGNLKKDLNKDIGTAAEEDIVYNYLNLPQSITVRKAGGLVKGTITYTYDAAGNKLKKEVNESSAPGVNRLITTTYIGGFVYDSKLTNQGGSPEPDDHTDLLQFIAHEEGRIRFKAAAGAVPASLQYDYMLKDHLGNVRMVLTEEQQQDKYPVASLEDAKVGTEDDFYNIQPTNIVLASSITQPPPAYTNDNGIGNNPADATFSAANSQKLYKLNSGTNKTGLGITLKVMAGDRIDIFGKSYYFQNNTGGSGANAAIPVLELLSGLMGTPGGATAGGHTTATELNGITGVTNPLSGTYLADPARDNASYTQRPKAFINYIFFDEQFKMVVGNYGFSAVSNTPGLKDHFSELQNKVAQKNGYVYIYVSNESPVNVFFDNLQVVHTRGAILEETHYYPFGLTMAGISSKAANITPNKEKTFQGQRFDDELGLNWIQFKWRNHDPQIGRFIEIDPLSEKYEYNSTYAFSENKVIRHVELEGLESWDFMSTLKNVAGFGHTTTKSFANNMVEEMKKPETYKNAVLGMGPVLGATLIGIATGGVGEGAFLRTSINTGVRTEVATAEISTIRQNAANGAAFEQKVGSDLVKAGDTKIAPQITIKADNGVKTRVDFISTNTNGQIALTEAKSSSTAPLTVNQTAAYPSIAQSGGVIVGQGKPGYPGGTVIPATTVNIVRPAPAVADATYVRPPITSLLSEKKN